MSRFAGLPAAMKGKPPKPSEEETDTPEDEGNSPKPRQKKDDDMADATNEAALAAATADGHSAGFKAATDRFTAVAASEHFAGREASAMKLLTNPAFASADAAAISDLLADMPKAEPVAALSEEQQREAAEEAGRKDMKAAITDAGGNRVEANGGGDGGVDQAAASAGVWDRAIARVAPTPKR